MGEGNVNRMYKS